eukprot:11176019-Prorocentrum_lima.AAC.1
MPGVKKPGEVEDKILDRNKRKLENHPQKWLDDAGFRVQRASVGCTRESNKAFTVLPWVPEHGLSVPPKQIDP